MAMAMLDYQGVFDFSNPFVFYIFLLPMSLAKNGFPTARTSSVTTQFSASLSTAVATTGWSSGRGLRPEKITTG